MRVSQVPFESLKIGQRIRGLNGRNGTIIHIDCNDDDYVWVLWDGDERVYGGWYGTNCEVELLDEQVSCDVLLKLRENCGFEQKVVRP